MRYIGRQVNGSDEIKLFDPNLCVNGISIITDDKINVDDLEGDNRIVLVLARKDGRERPRLGLSAPLWTLHIPLSAPVDNAQMEEQRVDDALMTGPGLEGPGSEVSSMDGDPTETLDVDGVQMEDPPVDDVLVAESSLKDARIEVPHTNSDRTAVDGKADEPSPSVGLWQARDPQELTDTAPHHRERSAFHGIVRKTDSSLTIHLRSTQKPENGWIRF
jgi:hypothetical protein